jgi:hypothetical protein
MAPKGAAVVCLGYVGLTLQKQKGYCVAYGGVKDHCTHEHPEEWKGKGSNYRIAALSETEMAEAMAQLRESRENERKEKVEAKAKKRAQLGKKREKKVKTVAIPFPDAAYLIKK